MTALKHSLLDFFKGESAVGILLILATFLAMLLANSPLAQTYQDFLDIPVVVSIHEFVIAKPLLLWVNDGLMAVFFFMVGLEIKREVLEGSLSHISKVVVPAFAAIGGMVVPAVVYSLFNWGDPTGMQGWAIPMATDIAFALGILSLLGKRVPVELKVFLLALAIIDDLGAIIVIALFFGHGLTMTALAVSGILIAVLMVMNWRGVTNNTVYVLLGIIIWAAVLKSGVHATIAGVIVGLLIPLRNNRKSFHELEESLHGPVNYVILPLFAFVNTGVGFGSVSVKDFVDNVTIGITLGLFLGKQIGIFSFGALAVMLRVGKLPEGFTWGHLYGISILGGIGFTMSLFIGSLAFECSGDACLNMTDERIGILLGSLFSGTVGYLFLRSQFHGQKESS
ncbi:Na+/H+ antiporter NhaA [Sulfurimonas sp. HSL3-7]|uniref:Na+/H+ antiporter NhaA n=1 Tax=Sulfonitrofixus jiaomeiensis TaxID=3131938 RepID=UPI0031F86905